MNNLEKEIALKLQEMYDKIIQSLPEGVYQHADGEWYVHQIWCDPRNPNSAEIHEIYKL